MSDRTGECCNLVVYKMLPRVQSFSIFFWIGHPIFRINASPSKKVAIMRRVAQKVLPMQWFRHSFREVGSGMEEEKIDQERVRRT